MKTVLLAAFGWLIPGGAYLLMRRYLQFSLFALAVWAAFGAGLALHGGVQWPQSADLAGLDGLAGFLFRAGAIGRMMAGAPYLLANLLGAPGTFLSDRVHEYGTTLLAMAGLINALAVSSALELRKERSH